MIRKMALWLPILIFLAGAGAWADNLATGKAPKPVTLKGDLGGHLDGKPWSSDELKGKVSIVFYVDPDEKDLNEDASEALKAKKFPREKYQSFGIINMAATWLPNFAISKSLEKKQKQYPDTIYVRDYKKVLVNSWGLGDDTSDVLVFDKEGTLIFRKDGKLSQDEINKLVQTVSDAVEK